MSAILQSPPKGIQSAKNLVVTRPAAGQVNITADEVVLVDSNGNIARHTAVNVTIDFANGVAINGLDAGAEAANTIYYCWLVSTGATIGGIFSTSSSAPTLPAGYTYKGLFSAGGNDNTSNLIDFKQTGSKYCFTTWAAMASGNVGTGAWVAIDMTPANMTTNPGFVPPGLSDFCFGGMYGELNVALTNKNSVSLTLTAPAPNRFSMSDAGNHEHPWTFNLITADTLYFMSDHVDATIYLHGFELNKVPL